MHCEVLVATMDQKDHNLLEKMNIQSDAIIGNQCDRNEIEEFNYNGWNIKYLSFAEKGVGLNRNNTLMRASGDICVIADDDVIFCDNYIKTIKRNFKDNPEADVIIFNLYEKQPKRFITERKFKVGYKNFMRFGATRIAFKRNSIIKKGITFNLLFGGGTHFSAGEDTLFLYECLSKKLNIIAVPDYIAELTEERESSWFKGYNDKFFRDRGALFACLSNKFSYLLSIQFALRHYKLFKGEKTRREAIKLMKAGIEEYRNYQNIKLETD